MQPGSIAQMAKPKIAEQEHQIQYHGPVIGM
jgi:hypothetical protein